MRTIHSVSTGRLTAALPTFASVNEAMEWLKTLGVAGFMFFLLKGIAWLVVFWLISRGVIRKHKVAKLKLRWRNLWRKEN